MGNPARVLLLAPGSVWSGSSMHTNLPVKLPLLSLFSYLAAHGVPVEVLDLQNELGQPEPRDDAVAGYLDAGAAALAAREADVLAISCWTSFDYLATMELARRVRDTAPGTLIVVGGYHASALPGDFTRPGSPVDVVVCGEGEQALLEIATAGRRRRAGGEGERQVVEGRPAPLDDLPLALESYPYPYGGKKVELALSRGCPGRCAFCASTAQPRTWQAYGLPRALDLMRRALALDPPVVDIVDACAGASRAWRRPFLEALRELAPEVPVSLQTRVTQLTVDDLDLLDGLDVMLQLGVETMSPRMAEVMEKARDGRRHVQKAAALLDAAAERDLFVTANVLVNHPGETDATMAETVAFFEGAVEGRTSLAIEPSIFTFLPGSAIAARRAWFEREYGAIVRSPRWWTVAEPQTPLATGVVASPGFDPAPWHERLVELNRAAITHWSPATQLHAFRRRRRLRPPAPPISGS